MTRTHAAAAAATLSLVCVSASAAVLIFRHSATGRKPRPSESVGNAAEERGALSPSSSREPWRESELLNRLAQGEVSSALDAEMRQYLAACQDPEVHQLLFEALARRNQKRNEALRQPRAPSARAHLADISSRSESDLADALLGADDSERRRAADILKRVDLSPTTLERLLAAYDRASAEVKLSILASVGEAEDERVAMILSSALAQCVDRLLQRGALDVLAARVNDGRSVDFARQDVGELVRSSSSYHTIHDGLLVLRATSTGEEDILRLVQVRMASETESSLREVLLSGLDGDLPAHARLALSFAADASPDVRSRVVCVLDKGLSGRWDVELYRALETAALSDTDADVRRSGLQSLLQIATFKQHELRQSGLLDPLRSRVQGAWRNATDVAEKQALEAILSTLAK